MTGLSQNDAPIRRELLEYLVELLNNDKIGNLSATTPEKSILALLTKGSPSAGQDMSPPGVTQAELDILDTVRAARS